MAEITGASAYSNALKQLKDSPKTEAGDNTSLFGDLVKTSLNSAIEAQHKSEQVSAAALAGQADMTEVVQAINDAEIALNTVLTIRDKVINAYQTIINTAI